MAGDHIAVGGGGLQQFHPFGGIGGDAVAVDQRDAEFADRLQIPARTGAFEPEDRRGGVGGDSDPAQITLSEPLLGDGIAEPRAAVVAPKRRLEVGSAAVAEAERVAEQGAGGRIVLGSRPFEEFPRGDGIMGEFWTKSACMAATLYNTSTVVQLFT